jgi:hypothetical protein
VSKASDDFPEPDRPVITTRRLRGSSTLRFYRLCVRAPRMRSVPWVSIAPEDESKLATIASSGSPIPDFLRPAMDSQRMSAVELRAGTSLAGIFGMRMFGLFLILPVFAVHAPQLAGGNNLVLVGLALGAYGLVQACLHIPFGMASDRWGRKPVMVIGLVIFAAGSFLAAGAEDIWTTIAGRGLQAPARSRRW